jgi:deoxyribonuclease (pyrimidine dimer)
MTRINLIPPVELRDQHLFAEFREIKMVPKSLARSIVAAGKRTGGALADKYVVSKIPKAFTLGTGHVSFFYDKGAFLYERYAQLKQELNARSVNYNRDSMFDPDGIMQLEPWNGAYNPTPEALQIIRQRIAEKIAMKPEWYKFYGKALEAQDESN